MPLIDSQPGSSEHPLVAVANRAAQAPAARDLVHEIQHKVCQPLTSLRCSLELMNLEAPAGTDRQKIDQALTECDRATYYLQVFQALLEASPDRSHFERCDLRESLAAVMTASSVLGAQSGITLLLDCEADVQVCTARARFTAAFEILLNDCVERSTPGSVVRISVEKRSEHLSLELLDAACISEQAFRRGLDPFVFPVTDSGLPPWEVLTSLQACVRTFAITRGNGGNRHFRMEFFIPKGPR